MQAASCHKLTHTRTCLGGNPASKKGSYSQNNTQTHGYNPTESVESESSQNSWSNRGVQHGAGCWYIMTSWNVGRAHCMASLMLPAGDGLESDVHPAAELQYINVAAMGLKTQPALRFVALNKTAPSVAAFDRFSRCLGRWSRWVRLQ